MPAAVASLPGAAWLALGVAVAAVAVAGLFLIRRGLLSPLAALEREARALTRFALQRPQPVERVVVRELRALQLRFQARRRRVMGALRSSTEQNLELDAEVARRSAELVRRNEELTHALGRLARTRDELVSTEQLATVGQIASTLTAAISGPVDQLLVESERLATGLAELRALWSQSEGELSTRKDELRERSAALVAALATIEASADRATSIIEAVRVYARPVGSAATGNGSERPPLAIREALAESGGATSAGR